MASTVSIVLPVYNQAHYLRAALDGVFAQTYPDYELVVVDDGSTDETPAVLLEYQGRYDFEVVRQENQGLPRALNTGFSRTQGAYLTWTSSDNVMLPDMLAVLVNALDGDRSVGLVYADRYLIDETGRDLGLLPAPEYDPYLLLHTNLVHCCFLYRRACMEAVGGYDPAFVYAEDWEYWIRISRYFHMKRIAVPLYRYRVHQHSMTSEIQRGTAPKMSYKEFTAKIRRRMPVRWGLGKAKWWGLRVTDPDNPVLAQRTVWRRLVETAAQEQDRS